MSAAQAGSAVNGTLLVIEAAGSMDVSPWLLNATDKYRPVDDGVAAALIV